MVLLRTVHRFFQVSRKGFQGGVATGWGPGASGRPNGSTVTDPETTSFGGTDDQLINQSKQKQFVNCFKAISNKLIN